MYAAIFNVLCNELQLFIDFKVIIKKNKGHSCLSKFYSFFIGVPGVEPPPLGTAKSYGFLVLMGPDSILKILSTKSRKSKNTV